MYKGISGEFEPRKLPWIQLWYILQSTKNLKKKFQALTYLRKKKETEKRIEKQLKALDNIQVLVSRIEESKYNSEVKNIVLKC